MISPAFAGTKLTGTWSVGISRPLLPGAMMRIYEIEVRCRKYTYEIAESDD